MSTCRHGRVCTQESVGVRLCCQQHADHFYVRCIFGHLAVRRPTIHQPPALLEQITTPISGLYFVANHVRQRRLSGLPRLAHAAAQLRNLALRSCMVRLDSCESFKNKLTPVTFPPGRFKRDNVANGRGRRLGACPSALLCEFQFILFHSQALLRSITLLAASAHVSGSGSNSAEMSRRRTTSFSFCESSQRIMSQALIVVLSTMGLGGSANR